MENNNNGWIKCTDRLPQLYTDFNLLIRSKMLLVFGLDEVDDEIPHIFSAYMIGGNRFYSSNGECKNVTHWQELPSPPKY